MPTTVTRHSWMTSEPVHYLVQVLVDGFEFNGTRYSANERIGLPVADALRLERLGKVKVL